MSEEGLPPRLAVRGVTRRFPGVRALDGVDLEIARGEVRVLVGSNGAGKSTLVRILSGADRADAGALALDGAPYAPRSAVDGLRAGVRVVYQELNLLPQLSVAENLLLEHLPRKGPFLDRAALAREAARLLREVGLDVPPGVPVARLGVAQRQLVEIARALSASSRVLILDEPTATLTPPEIERLFAILRRARERGTAVIYISHRLAEAFEIGDRVTVLRDGRVVRTVDAAATSVGDLVRSMVGRDVDAEVPFRADAAPGVEALRVEGLRARGARGAVSLAVRSGEILGLAGLVGAGRTETVRALFGADRRTAGRIVVDGREVSIRSPRDAVRHGLGLLTEDRKAEGLLLDLPCAANVTLAALRKVSRAGWLRRRIERSAAERYARDLAVRTPSVAAPARTLSGGNQQKLLLARWLFREARIVVLDEPTRGVDVGARREIHEILGALAAEGKALVVVSSDLPELLGLCHRIVVFSRGAVSGELERSAFSQEAVLDLAFRAHVAPEAA